MIKRISETGRLKHRHETSLGDHQRPAQVFIGHGAEDDADDQGGNGIPHVGQEIADDADRQHEVEVENIQPE